MDVLLFHPYLDAMGGAERVVLEIARHYNSPIYCVKYAKEATYPEFSEFDIRLLPRSAIERPLYAAAKALGDARAGGVAVAAARFFSCGVREDFDVLNPHLTPSHWIANRNERVCWYCHSPSRVGYDLNRYYAAGIGMAERAVLGVMTAAFRMIDRRCVGRIEKVCANSETTRLRLKRYLGREDAAVIRPGVDAKEYSCETYGKYFLCVSRIVPEKRFELAISAFRQFRKRARGGWRLVIAGHLEPIARNRAVLERIKETADGLPVEVKLNLPPLEMRKLYANCYATLFCAIEEDFGLVPLESMASGKPCISMNEGGPMESIVSGKTGFLVNSAGEMADRMLFLAENPDLCEKMGKAGRRHVERNFTWKIFLEGIGRAFRETARRNA